MQRTGIAPMESSVTPATGIAARINWYLLKLPLTLALIVIGFLLEAAIQWPFALLCRLNARPKARRS